MIIIKNQESHTPRKSWKRKARGTQQTKNLAGKERKEGERKRKSGKRRNQEKRNHGRASLTQGKKEERNKAPPYKKKQKTNQGAGQAGTRLYAPRSMKGHGEPK